MPELPEVESLRVGLLKYLVDHRILDVQVNLAKLVSSKGTTRVSLKAKEEEFTSGITNRIITQIKRRAKNLIFVFDNGSMLLVHLKMTGQLVFKPDSKNSSEQKLVFGGHPIEATHISLPHKHTYVIFKLDNGTLYYNDVRQFGYLLYYPNNQLFESENHFAKLGLEPLDSDFEFEQFYTKLKTKKGILKSVFLNQEVVVGLGNIYADEVCFKAKILPFKRVESLNKKEIKTLFESIQIILPKAVLLGGSSVANYLLADGSKGNYAREHKVYNRGGKSCLVCGSILEKQKIAGRTTVFCIKCQY